MSDLNGHAPVLELPAGRMRGRTAPNHPSTVLPNSGHTVHVRRLTTGVMAQLFAKAYQELEGTRPTPPTQSVEVAPDVFRDVERTSDPDFADALAAWGEKVAARAGLKFTKLIEAYALITPTDAEAVSEYRAAMEAVGVDTSDKGDREIFCWEIVAPTSEDQQHLMGFVRGLSEAQQEAVQAHKRTFRGDLPGQSTGTAGDAGGERPL